MYRYIFAFLCSMALFFAPGAALAKSLKENGDLLSSALAAMAEKDWAKADQFAAQISDSVGAELVLWERLRQGEAGWDEYEAFLAEHPDWPGLKRLRRAGEEVIPRNHDPASVRRFFADQPPQTGTGSLRLAEALQAQGHSAEARAEVNRAWRDITLLPEEEAELLDRFGSVLSRHHQDRLENLLWNGQTSAAERMLQHVPEAQARLAKARIGLQRAVKGVDGLIDAVPRGLADDPGLAFDRFMWRVGKERWDDAEALLLERSGSAESLGRPEEWSNRRRGFARRAMRDGNPQMAYLLASQHGLSEGDNYADLEWLSGFIALTELASPEQALFHFTRFWSAVSSPISLGRAGYWLGRTYEALGQTEEAVQAYRLGARHQTSFYGQLAAERIDMAPDPRLTGKADFPDWRSATFTGSGPIRAAVLMHYAQEQPMMRWFFAHVAETLDEVGLLQLSQLALELGRPHVALAVAKEAAKRGIVLPGSYFPVTDLAGYSVDVDPEVALSIARRESELNEAAISPAGAQGLMQIMPGTARDVSRDLGIAYSKARLTSDWRYNARLGSAYLGSLLELYDGSYVLAFAAYNAGPNRVDVWIAEYGDPRDSNVDKVNWIEHIPYRETRDYVMRVMESLHVYRARISGVAQPLRITRDMSRG